MKYDIKNTINVHDLFDIPVNTIFVKQMNECEIFLATDAYLDEDGEIFHPKPDVDFDIANSKRICIGLHNGKVYTFINIPVNVLKQTNTLEFNYAT